MESALLVGLRVVVLERWCVVGPYPNPCPWEGNDEFMS